MRCTTFQITRSLLALGVCLGLFLDVPAVFGQEPASEQPPELVSPELASPEQAPPELAPTAEAAEAPTGVSPEEAEAADDRNRISFDLSFPPEQGGGSAAGSAGSISYRGADFAVLRGGVEVRYQDLKLQADQVDVNLATKEVTAVGNVILDQGPRRLSGTSITFDLETKTGTVQSASAYVDPDFYFKGEEVIKTGDDTYRVINGMFTSCEGEVPAWSFHVKEADIEVDGYAHIRGASMRAKKLPVFYLPYMVWPVKPERTRGLLVPNIGYSSRRGSYLGLAYFLPMGRSWDTTFHADYFSENYYGIGNELRWNPSEGTRGEMQAYAIHDPDSDDWRWKVNLDHATTDLPWGLRGVVTVREYSDFEWFREFERGVGNSTTRSTESRGYLSGNWGPHSFNMLVDRRETFITGAQDVVLQRLPELEYRLRAFQLSDRVPLFVKMESSLALLDVDRNANLGAQYGRFDLFPQLQLPVRIAPWLSLSMTAGSRYTWWGDSLEPGGASFSGDTLSRSYAFGEAELVGPSFSRIFESEDGRFSKFKHVVEPRFTYTYQEEYDDRTLVPLFDEVDNVGQANIGRVALVNRLLAKPRPKPLPPLEGDAEEGSKEGAEPAPVIEPSAREILSLEVSRSYSFDDLQPLERSANGLMEDQAGPLRTRLRFNPSDATSLTADVDYSLLFSQISSTSLSGTVGLPGNNLVSLSWRTRWNAETGERNSDQLRFGTSLNLLPRRLKLQTDLVYDLEKSERQQQRYILNYTGECYGFMLEYRELLERNELEDEFRFSLTLKNVGTFLELTN